MTTLEILWAIGSGLIGLVVGWWSYNRLPIRHTPMQRWILTALRSIVVAGLLWLLVEPVLRLTRPTAQKPLLLLLADDSKSIFWGEAISPEAYRARLDSLVKALEEVGFTVEARRFDRTIHPWGVFSGKGEGTALYDALLDMREAFPQAEGAILISDGIDNSSKRMVGEVGLPLWAVGVGPKAPPADAAITEVVLPPWCEVGRKHDIEVRFSQLNQAGLLTVQVLGSVRSWPVPAQSKAFRVPLTFSEPGPVPVTLRLDVPGDPNPANNTYTPVIAVRAATPRIAIWAGEITPDIAFLRHSLERIGPVTLLLAKKPTGFTASPDTLSWGAYAIHVLYNFPLRVEDTVYVGRILRAGGVPWVVWGASVSEGLVRPYFPRLGWQGLGPLRSVPLGKEAMLLVRTEQLSPAAEKLSGPMGPWAYRFVQGNEAAVGLLGEGWWQLRTLPTWIAAWDSLIGELASWSLRFYRAPALLLPQRSRYTLGETVLWSGQAPSEARLLIRRPSGGLDTFVAAAGLSYKPPEAGLYTYTLRQGQTNLHEGAFWVEATSLEMQRLGIDTLTLRFLSSAYLPWDSLLALPTHIQRTIPPQTLVHLHTDILPIHEWWPWLALLLGLLSLEWLLRRYWGLY